MVLLGELNLELGASVTLLVADKHIGSSNIFRLDHLNLEGGLVAVGRVVGGVNVARYVGPKHAARCESQVLLREVGVFGLVRV